MKIKEMSNEGLFALDMANSYADTAMIHGGKTKKETDSFINSIVSDESFNDFLHLKLRDFIAYVKIKSNNVNVYSFKSNPFIDGDENYKNEIWNIANEIIKNKLSKCTNFGSGEFLDTLVECIEIQGNNLLEWIGKNGPDSKVHLQLLELKQDKTILKEFEFITYQFFFSSEQPEMFYFDYFTNLVNKKYSLIAYIYFIKNCSLYLPLATKTFDTFFEEAGVDFKTSYKCSWENYYEFISILEYVREFLRENYDSNATLIDAHSFIWILERQYKRDLANKSYKTPKEYELKEKDREVIVKARKGQGLYRTRLLEKWNNSSSISNFSNPKFLKASHIKPWRKCDNKECIDPENGLLLKPDYDYLFDQGYISFNDDGSIIISDKLSKEDIEELNISQSIKIKKVSEKMKEYLDYHRRFVFEK